MKMRPLLFPTLACLVAFLSSPLSALEPADLSRILDAPELDFTLETSIGGAAESSTFSIAGGSSLKITPAFDAEQGSQAIILKLKIAASGPGRVSFQVRSAKADPRIFSVNSAPGYEALPEVIAEDTWYPASFTVFPEAEEIVLSISTILDNGDAALYLDAFSFQPGVSIQIQDIPEAGPILLSPQKELYQVGERVSVSLQPAASSITASITEIDPRFAISKDRPNSFTIVAENDLVLRATYQQALEIPGLKASARLVNSLIDLEADNSITTGKLVLEDIPANSLLAFDATLVDGKTVTIYGETSIPLLRLERSLPNLAFESLPGQVLRFDFPLAKLEFTLDEWPLENRVLIENLRLITNPSVLLQTSGQGSASVEYAETSDPNILQATLTALPEPGWVFERWSGDIDSYSSSFTTLLDGPRVTQARFIEASDSENRDIEFTLSAPPGSLSLTPDKEAYQIGDTLSLSIEGSYRDRFVAWTGDLYSTSPTIELELLQPTHIQAVFSHPIENASPYGIENSGTLLFPPIANSQNLAFPSQTFALQDWTEFSIPLDGPLAVGLTFNGYGQMFVRGWLDNKSLGEEAISISGNTIYCNSTSPAGGTLRIRITNTNESPQTFGISKLGFYHDVNLWHDGTNPYHNIRPTFTVSPEKRFHEIGSTVTLTPNPYDPQEFVSWDSPQLSAGEREYTLPSKGPILVKPHFGIADEPDGIQFLLNESSSWSLLGGIDFTNSNTFENNEVRSLVLEVSGPGVLAFTHAANSLFPFGNVEEPVELEVLDDGAPARLGDFKLTSKQGDRELLIDAGLHRIEILTTISLEAIAKDVDVTLTRLNDFQFIPGYAVVSDPSYPQALAVAPPQTPAVYAPGTSVTISDAYLWEAPFGRWTGDLAGSPSTVQLELDRHIVANPAESLTRQFDILSSTITENARFSTIAEASSIIYYIESSSGPTELTFEIPALTELSLSLGSYNAPTQVIVNDTTAYSGASDSIDITIPVKETAQTIIVQIELDPTSSEQAYVQAIPYQSFQLSGYFGEQQEYTIPSPAKDSYAPGEKVTISLGNGVDSDFVFYDVAIAYPTLDIIEWPDLDGQKSFEVEMSSHVTLLGRVGEAPARETGDLVLGYDISLFNTTEETPDGGSAKQATLLADFSTLRIVTRGARHLDFWIQLPIGTELIFNEIEIDGLPLAIEGNGLWQKASIAVPQNANYLNAYLSAPYQGIQFLISDVSTQTNYGIQYLLTGNSSILQSPTNGTGSPDSPITLKLIPDDGFHFSSWGALDAQDATLVAKPSQTPFLLPAVEEDEEFVRLDGYDFLLEGPTASQSENSVTFRDEGDTISALVDGPARVTYDFQKNGSVDITTSLDGEAFYWANQFPDGFRQNDRELLIPAGKHLLELKFAKAFPQRSDSATLTNLTVEAGAYLWFNPYQSAGSLSASSDQRFIPQGESITLTATPDYDYVFDSWQSALGSLPATPEIALSPSDHSELSATFRYERSFSLQGLDWEQLSDPNKTSYFLSQTIAEGPGYFKIDQYLSRSTGFSARLNGLLAKTYPHGSFNYLPIPAGKHRIEFSTYSSPANLEHTAYFIPGYLLLLAGESDLLTPSPQQDSYVLGTRVSITQLPSNPSDKLDTFQVGEQFLNGSQNLEFDILGHTILPVSRSHAIAGTAFHTNAPSEHISVESNSNDPAFLITPTYEFPLSLERTFQGPGTLRFTLDNLEPARLDLLLGSETALTTSEDGDYQLLLPPGAHTLRWQLTTAESPKWLEPVAIQNITFNAEVLTEFQTWMASQIPAHLFARGLDLSPTDDLDHDGLSNQQERDSGTNPAFFDLPVRIIPHQKDQYSITFELPETIDPASIFTLALIEDGSMRYWGRIAIASIDSRKETPTGKSTTLFEIPIQDPPQEATLFKIAVEQE
ncbi:hypothetical protein VDG1235_4208 [Verrucomicrobiia bacterium DG1235]|nr:hypothetical protein VDG1235_4208 [Verrucomicrobiae bacterium DG1235]